MTYTDTATGEVVDTLPACNTNDPADLEAWFGNFGFSDHFRKVVLASCKEVERAKAVERNEKITVDRLDDLARTSDAYVSFLVENLNGRRLREQNVRDSMAR